MTPLDAIRRALDASRGSAKAFQAELAEAGFIVISAARAAELLDASEPSPPWRSMASAPLNASTVLLRFPAHGGNRPAVLAAHWAQDLSGEEQPPFKGWFYPVVTDGGRVSYYAHINVTPDGWMPLPIGREHREVPTP